MEQVKSYPILIWQKDGRIYGRIKELEILESADDVNALMEIIESRKNDVIKRFRDSGIESEIPTSTICDDLKLIDKSIQRFAIRTFLVTLAVVVSISVIGNELTDLVKTVKLEFKIRKPIHEFANNLENKTEEQREELRRSLRTISAQLLPYLQEIKPIIQEFSSSDCSDKKATIKKYRQ